MSYRSVHKVVYPHCKNEYEVECYDTVNITIDKELFSDFRNGKLFVEECKYCKQKYNYLRPLIYHDMEKKFIVYYVNSIDMLEDAILELDEFKGAFNGIYKDYKLRIVVDSIIKFIEKVEVLTNGLDDRVIEVYKLIMVDNLKITEDQLFYIEFIKDMTDQRFTLIKENGVEEYFGFSKECYDGMSEDLNACECFVKDDSYVVDYQYADNMLDKCDEETKSKN